MRNLNKILMLFAVTIGATHDAARAASQLSKGLQEVRELSTDDFVKKVTSDINNINAVYLRASSIWFTLHLGADENWIGPLTGWPDEISFKDFLNSQGSEYRNIFPQPADERFHYSQSTFAQNPLRDQTDDLDSVSVKSLSGIEIDSAKNITNEPLSWNQSHLQNLHGLYSQISEVVDGFTKMRLDLEILLDQLVAMNLGRDQGYYLMGFSPENQKYLKDLSEVVETLFLQVKKVRTESIVPIYDSVVGMVNGTSTVTYKTTSEFKSDVERLFSDLKRATPAISAIGSQIYFISKELSKLNGPNQVALSFTKSKTAEVSARVDELFGKLSTLAAEEHRQILLSNMTQSSSWLNWYSNNRQKYESIMYELHEIFGYQANVGSDFYKFQSRYFKLNSTNRKLYRGLEALLFAHGEVQTYIANMARSSSSQRPQWLIEPRALLAVLKHRDFIILNIVGDADMNCKAALTR